jgi:hypothetical protein
MDPNTARGLINQLVYTVQFSPDLSDATRLDLLANNIQSQRGFRHSSAEYSEAIELVLADSHLPRETLSMARHKEGDLLTWLANLAQRLDRDARQAEK